ncbi:sporulation protein [Pseudenhygromyxa sp. WMMC2535]|uniref:sporulation protein n=1 Tax=Pseudenhygromyxa sp. WMMC2535 TaxID=2712867 RepID=UPI0015960565|nr:sporulation protein [Pseudenhygromyxa sp. WMMC2535]NVB40009.1 sporulation protein [Pseudenhygromyxa sp. WMMC2535]
MVVPARITTMGFSDKMRETLGSEGARIDVLTDDEGWAARLAPGQAGQAKVRLSGGTKTARVEGVMFYVLIRHRQWSDGQGMVFTDEQASELEDRRHLTPSWTRELLAQVRVAVHEEVEPGDEREVSVDLDLPEHCDRTSAACTINILAQADIRGQIDPTATGKLLVA